MAKIALIIVAVIAASSVWASDPSDALLKANVKTNLAVQDDAMDTHIRVDSSKVWKQRPTRPDMFISDVFLRAWIDKKTGSIRAQAYYYTNYHSGGWWFINQAAYEGVSGVEAAQVDKIGSKVDGCRRYSSCDYVEHVGFDVPWPVLEHHAARYTEADRQVWWKIRFRSQSGDMVDIGIPLGEVAGFVERVNELKTKH